MTGGSNTNAYGLYSTASSTITVSGGVTGGSNTNAYGLYSTAARGDITIRGSILNGNGENAAYAVYTTGSFPAIRISGDIYSGGMAGSTGSTGRFPVAGAWCMIRGEALRIHVYDDSAFPTGNNGTPRVLEISGGAHPSPADVREGANYGPDNSVVGTLAVPPKATVMAGVPVDNSVGTLPLATLVDVAQVTGAQIAAAAGV